MHTNYEKKSQKPFFLPPVQHTKHVISDFRVFTSSCIFNNVHHVSMFIVSNKFIIEVMSLNRQSKLQFVETNVKCALLFIQLMLSIFCPLALCDLMSKKCYFVLIFFKKKVMI